MESNWFANSIGLLALTVSLITEATKNIGWLKKIPTDLQVLALSLLLSELALVIRASSQGLALAWYMPLLALSAGCVAAFVARYGWSAYHELRERFLSPGQDRG